MSKFIINNSYKLNGKIEVSGMKNSALPILSACLLIKEDVEISNIPDIKDIEKMLIIMESIGVKIKRLSNNSFIINSKDINPENIDKQTMKKFRGSILLLGSLLNRFKEVNLPEPGGCIIGNRPIDNHLEALKKLGVKFIEGRGEYKFKAEKLIGNEIIIPDFSVTGTENTILAAVMAEGKTLIKLAACEPHVYDLCSFLNKCGAKIKFEESCHLIEIEGVKELHGTSYNIIPDQIEAGTYLILGAITRGEILVDKINPNHLDSLICRLNQVGVKLEINQNSILVKDNPDLKSIREIKTYPYPGFPTDLQSPMGVLATQCSGTTIIHDSVYEGRMGYINELMKMGASAIIADPHRAIISGITKLYGTEINTLDLRAGAAVILAGIIADGQTIIYNSEIIDRGYEKIENKLQKIGVDIKKIDD
ncbi:UDP-N-acetylglucosamine 1-carboxyvinyltransferase [bacterium]|nr:UDP-N-acetylglucosamine 1-carboxyvinyltransferase [bacterium]